MYVAADVGASKTLIGVFNAQGQILKRRKFNTPRIYSDWLAKFTAAVRTAQGPGSVRALGVGIPCSLDPEDKHIVGCGNLAWQGEHPAKDLEKALKVPIYIANDAVCGGLAEATMGAGKDFKRLFYITISTGVGTALIVNKHPSRDVPNSEGGQIIVDRNKSGFLRLEDLISGPAIIERFGKPAYDIDDLNIWKQLAVDMAIGIYNMVTLTFPDGVVIGGGVAVHFEIFKKHLIDAINQLDSKIYALPPIVKASQVEEAALYGAFLIAKTPSHDS